MKATNNNADTCIRIKDDPRTECCQPFKHSNFCHTIIHMKLPGYQKLDILKLRRLLQRGNPQESYLYGKKTL